MRLQRLVPLALVVACVAGCGSSSSDAGSGGADPAQAIPARTLVYVEAVVRPQGDQGDAARALLARFLPSGTTLESLVDESIQDEEPDKSYAEDVKPWLGERIGLGVVDLTADDPSFIAAVDVTDADEAEAFLKSGEGVSERGRYHDTALYQDHDTWAAVKDDYVFLAETQANLRKGMDAAEGDSLGDAKSFEDAVGKLPDARLGSLFVDLEGVGALLDRAPDVDPAARAVLKQVLGDDLQPITAALTATDDAATVESRFAGAGLTRLTSLGLLGAGESTELVKDAPADAFAVFGAAKVGGSLRGAIDTFAGALGGAALTGQIESQTGVNLERDVFSWVGDVAVYAHGDSMATLNGALIIEVSDEAAARAAIPKLVAAARKQGAPVGGADVPGADQAFAVPAPGAPGPVVLAQGGDRVVLAFGEQEAAAAFDPGSDTLGSGGRYDTAQDAIDGLEPSLIVALQPILSLVEASGDTDADYAEAKPYLEKLDLVVSGSEKDGDTLRSLFTVTTK